MYELSAARIAVRSLASISTKREFPLTYTLVVALSEGIDSVSGRRAEYTIFAMCSDSNGISKIEFPSTSF